MASKEVTPAEVEEFLKGLRRLDVDVSPDRKGHLEYVEFHIPRITFLVNFLKRFIRRGSSLLTIGHEPNYLDIALMRFLDSPLSVIGVDISRYGSQRGMHREVLFQDEEGREYRFESFFYDLSHDEVPFQEKIFDVVTFFDVIEHILYDPAILFGRVYTLLKEGGFFFITTPNGQFWHRILYAVRGFRYVDRRNYHEDLAMRHNFIFGLPELKNLLMGEKFEIVESRFETFRGPPESDIREMKAVNPVISDELLHHEAHRHTDIVCVARRPLP